MEELTSRQKAILDFIDQNIRERGYPPTLREICKKFSISSTNGARYHLHRLGRMGYLEIERYASRGVKRIGASSPGSVSRRNYRMPILGRVPAGPLNLAAPDLREEEMVVDPEFFGSRASEPELFGLRVKGDSMVEAGIYDGDIVVVRPQNLADDGDIVVARVEEEATVKRFYRQNGDIVLQPANPDYSPIRIPNQGGKENGQDIGIVGVVVGLIRAM